MSFAEGGYRSGDLPAGSRDERSFPEGKRTWRDRLAELGRGALSCLAVSAGDFVQGPPIPAELLALHVEPAEPAEPALEGFDAELALLLDGKIPRLEQ